ncbi:MAG: hypothetical protein AB7I19_08740 [Planctomycetota bacterium]
MRSSSRTRSLGSAAACLAVLTSCSWFSGQEGDPLVEQPSLPYSVLVVGGAVVESSSPSAGSSNPLASTFPAASGAILITHDELATALRSTRVFTRVAVEPMANEDARLWLELGSVRDGLPLSDPRVAALLARARKGGHDFVLVLHRVVDGGIEDYGINERWPLTAATWLLVGLGVLVSDHTYESRAVLESSLFDAEEGRLLHRSIGSGAIVELSLLERTDFVGLLQSVLVPPFWVASDGESIVESLREPTIARLLGSMARELKGLACRRDIAENLGVEIEVSRDRADWNIDVFAREGIASASIVVDGVAAPAELEGQFVSQLLLSQEEEPSGRVLARARWSPPTGARMLQVLIRTVSGRLVSSTVELNGR